MNRAHLELCSSAEWAEMIETQAIPWVTEGVRLGDDVPGVRPETRARDWAARCPRSG